jgi:hypothetical protein
MGHTLTIRLDKDLAQWLEAESAKTGLSQGRIVREQLEKARATSEKPWMRLAGSIRGGPPDVSTRKGFSKR